MLKKTISCYYLFIKTAGPHRQYRQIILYRYMLVLFEKISFNFNFYRHFSNTTIAYLFTELLWFIISFICITNIKKTKKTLRFSYNALYLGIILGQKGDGGGIHWHALPIFIQPPHFYPYKKPLIKNNQLKHTLFHYLSQKINKKQCFGSVILERIRILGSVPLD